MPNRWNVPASALKSVNLVSLAKPSHESIEFSVAAGNYRRRGRGRNHSLFDPTKETGPICGLPIEGRKKEYYLSGFSRRR